MQPINISHVDTDPAASLDGDLHKRLQPALGLYPWGKSSCVCCNPQQQLIRGEARKLCTEHCAYTLQLAVLCFNCCQSINRIWEMPWKLPPALHLDH